MTRPERAVVAAVCIACGYAALIGVLVAGRALEDAARARAKKVAAQSHPTPPAGRIGGSKEVRPELATPTGPTASVRETA